MRTLLFVFICFGVVNTLQAQLTPNRNAVVQNDVKKPGVLNANELNPLQIADKGQQVQYFDGLGRPLQTVMTQAGTGNRDIIMPSSYDEYGREIKKYKPYADLNNSGMGSFRNNAYAEQSSYYATGSSSDGPKDINPYSQNLIEFSPLGRMVQPGAPGQTWQPGNKTVAYSYHVNTTTDAVKILKMGSSNAELGEYVKVGEYVAGELVKVISKDENSKQVVEFKDKEGKLVMKKVQLTAAADNGTGTGSTGWLCTYYIYDDFNSLRGVIQPLGVKTLEQNGWIFTQLILDEQCFRYDYDARRRMIIKKVPGARMVYMVYNSRDNLVMSQDGNLRNGALWLLYKYDSKNQLIETDIAIMPNTTTRYQLSLEAENVVNYVPSQLIAFDPHIQTFYDNYDWIINWVSPSVLNGDYDNSANTHFSQNTTTWPYPEYNTVGSKDLRGKVTGTRIRVLATGMFLYTVNIYDDKGRIIQVKSTAVNGGVDVVTTQYAWSGLPMHIVHQMKNSAGSLEQLTVTKTSYTPQGQVDRIEKRVQHPAVNGGQLGNWVTIGKMDYDQLGKVKTKSVGFNSTTSSYLETLSNDYNIRDWLLGVNRNYLSTATSNWFGFELAYDNVTGSSPGSSYASAQYNGNINGTTWKSKGDLKVRRFNYEYDAANRLTKANFGQLNGSAYTTNQGMNFTVENLTYDENGNIKSMRQYGWKPGGSSMIDDLVYSYHDGGLSNRLRNVTDNVNNPQTKLGDFRTGQWYLNQIGTKTTGTEDYKYDVNGNLTMDKNKAIPENGITYNYLNQPETIVVYNEPGNVRSIIYQYDALGNKLKKTVNEPGQPAKVTIYRMGSVYENDVLQFTAHEEGRFRVVPATQTVPASIAFDYFLKDHLGNVRMVLTSETKTDQYPAATMETAQATTEQALYSNISTTRVAKPAGYPTDNYTNPNANVARVNGGTQKIGPSKLLKVMAGDKINFRVSSWYKTTNTPGTPSSLLTGLVNLVATAIGGLPATKGSFTDLISTNALNPGLTSFVNSTGTYNTARPKAFVNWVLLDEQFNLVSNGSGFEQVGASNAFTVHQRSNLTMSSSGYLYIYVSNETSNIPVFFDNLQLTHVHGPLIEETHYYPFGLPMVGISSKALGLVENRSKFNGKEIQNNEFYDGSGLEMYDFKYRLYDMQLGRFFNQDRLADNFAYMSPYQFCSNNPIWFREIDGLEGVKYTDVDKNGNKITVVEKNIIVLTQSKKVIPSGASQKQIDRINKKNLNIEKSNTEKVEAAKKELNTFYNGSNGNGATDSKGNPVVFKFNVTGVNDFDKKGMSQMEIDKKYNEMGANAGIDGTFNLNGVINTIRVKAGVFTNESSGSVQGRTTGATVIRMNFGVPLGTFSHEVLHTLGLDDNGYTKGGLLNSPPEQINSSEVDAVLKLAYDKK